MLNFDLSSRRLSLTAIVALCLGLGACGGGDDKPSSMAPERLGQVASVRLNYRYEADVPAPTLDPLRAPQEINATIQADFDATRNFELLERTIASADQKKIVAVYRHISDAAAEYRLDMYSPNGKLQRKMTSDTMAVHFPDTIVWSPDSNTLAFVAATRVVSAVPTPTIIPTDPAPIPPALTETGEVVEGTEALETTPTPAAVPTPVAPTGILAFRTEQIYIANADGTGARPITENEGIIYFYYAWSPDSTMLVSLASTASEWRYREVLASSKGEKMTPAGRPRIVEKNGRERRLDDNQTTVRPVWSPDSTKVAAAFDNQIRIYDAAGTNPTQAAIPLRNQLLISSQAYDRQQQRAGQAADANANGSVQPEPVATPDQPLSALPDEKLLVSYNPIVELAWTADDLLYLQTAYLRRMVNEADVRSFSRWHRLPLSPQVTTPTKP